MQIVPQMEMKETGNCQAGELVRLTWDNMPLAIIAKQNDIFFAVVLEDGQVGTAPRFLRCDDPTSRVLSYGHQVILQVDQNGPHEIRTNQLHDLNGAIVIDGNRTLMRVGPARGGRPYSSVYIDLFTGMLTESPRRDFSTFASWEISVPIAGTERTLSLLKFAGAASNG